MDAKEKTFRMQLKKTEGQLWYFNIYSVIFDECFYQN